VLYIPLLKGRIFSAEEPVWNKRSLDAGLAEVGLVFGIITLGWGWLGAAEEWVGVEQAQPVR